MDQHIRTASPIAHRPQATKPAVHGTTVRVATTAANQFPSTSHPSAPPPPTQQVTAPLPAPQPALSAPTPKQKRPSQLRRDKRRLEEYLAKRKEQKQHYLLNNKVAQHLPSPPPLPATLEPMETEGPIPVGSTTPGINCHQPRPTATSTLPEKMEISPEQALETLGGSTPKRWEEVDPNAIWWTASPIAHRPQATKPAVHRTTVRGATTAANRSPSASRPASADRQAAPSGTLQPATQQVAAPLPAPQPALSAPTPKQKRPSQLRRDKRRLEEHLAKRKEQKQREHPSCIR